MSDAQETDAAFPTWDAATIDELHAYGSERAVSAGDVLLQAGRRSEGFYVVLDGEVEVVRHDVECEEPVGVLTPGQFVGGASPDPTSPAGDHDRPIGEEVFGED